MVFNNIPSPRYGGYGNAPSPRYGGYGHVPSPSPRFGGGNMIETSPSYNSMAEAHEAELLSEATTQAMIAARSILTNGGSQTIALSTAKAAAQSTLEQKAAFFGGHRLMKKYKNPRKARSQAELVASMAIMTVRQNLYYDDQGSVNTNQQDYQGSVNGNQQDYFGSTHGSRHDYSRHQGQSSPSASAARQAVQMHRTSSCSVGSANGEHAFNSSPFPMHIRIRSGPSVRSSGGQYQSDPVTHSPGAHYQGDQEDESSRARGMPPRPGPRRAGAEWFRKRLPFVKSNRSLTAPRSNSPAAGSTSSGEDRAAAGNNHNHELPPRPPSHQSLHSAESPVKSFHGSEGKPIIKEDCSQHITPRLTNTGSNNSSSDGGTRTHSFRREADTVGISTLGPPAVVPIKTIDTTDGLTTLGPPFMDAATNQEQSFVDRNFGPIVAVIANVFFCGNSPTNETKETKKQLEIWETSTQGRSVADADTLKSFLESTDSDSTNDSDDQSTILGLRELSQSMENLLGNFRQSVLTVDPKTTLTSALPAPVKHAVDHLGTSEGQRKLRKAARKKCLSPARKKRSKVPETENGASSV